MEPKYSYKMTLFGGYSYSSPRHYLSGCFYPAPENLEKLKNEFEKYNVRVKITKDGIVTCSTVKENSEFLNKFNDIEWLKQFY